MELLRRGYAVRTTVRSPSREQAVRAALAPLVNSTDPLTFAAADLTRDGGWEAAVAGCDYVLHVASPLGADAPRDRDALIGPARDGTLRVLRAATRGGCPAGGDDLRHRRRYPDLDGFGQHRRGDRVDRP